MIRLYLPASIWRMILSSWYTSRESPPQADDVERIPPFVRHDAHCLGHSL